MGSTDATVRSWKSFYRHPLATATDFERLCRQRKLLPGGAVETLNEWAFDRFDEPIIEEGETITVRRDLMEAA